ncbi:MAG: hypothetical protein KDK36_00385, partial [Leptospiraceae bacterium]|nr:hypothetical protein [Leptospiraceae bacterium]
MIEILILIINKIKKRLNQTDLNKILVFYFSYSMMSIELSLIRISDVLFYPGTTFFILTISLFSVGISGVLYHFSKWKYSLETSIFTQILLCIISYIVTKYTKNFEIIHFVLIMLPVVGSTFFIISLFDKNKNYTNKLYFFDLLGLATSGFIFLSIFNNIGPFGVLLLNILIGLAVYIIIFNTLSSFRIFFKLLFLVILCVFLIIQYNANEIIYPQANKYLPKSTKSEMIEHSQWSAYGKIDIIDPNRTKKNELILETSQLKYLFFDGGTIGTNFYKFNGDYQNLESNYLNDPEKHFLRLGALISHYLLKDINHNAYLMGVGAGQELKAALMYNASKIYANELNNDIIELVKGKYSNFIGNIFLDNRVSIISGDGRLSLNKVHESLDIIQIFSNYLSSTIASGKGIFAISNLFTVESFDEYFNKLTQDGILHINQYGYNLIYKIAEKSWQPYLTTDFSEHFIAIENISKKDILTTILIKKSAWKKDEIENIKTFFQKDPKYKYQIIIGSDVKNSINHLEIPVDKKPFFSFYLKNKYPKFYNLDYYNWILIVLFISFLFTVIFSKFKFSVIDSIIFYTLGIAFSFIQLTLENIFRRVIEFPHWINFLSICILIIAMSVGSIYKGFDFKRNEFKISLFSGPILILLFVFSYHNIFNYISDLNIAFRFFYCFFVVFLIGFSIGFIFPQLI